MSSSSETESHEFPDRSGRQNATRVLVVIRGGRDSNLCERQCPTSCVDPGDDLSKRHALAQNLCA